MLHRPLSAFLVVLVAGIPDTSVLLTDDTPPGSSPLQVFEERIMPIFKSENPSSCVQCHLAAVDLKDYILPSHEKTFASLRAQALIDLDAPEESKILQLIRMGEKDLDARARRIHAEQRRAEYDAFAAWIAACCADPALRGLPAPEPELSEPAGPRRPDAVIRHARKSRVVDSFARNVWSQRMRCFPCHTPYELDPSNPRHDKPRERVAALEEALGPEYTERLRIFKESPEATLQHLVERSRETPAGELPLINLHDPRKSLLLLKPTARLPSRSDGKMAPPSNVEPVSHRGGIKIHVDDPAYKSFVAWLEDYARVARDGYASVEDLPADNWHATTHFVLVENAPWPEATRVQLFVHARDEASGAWGAEPVAFTQSVVTPRMRLVGALFVVGPGTAESAGEPTRETERLQLDAGRYLIKAFVDSNRRLADAPASLLGEEEYAGEVEVDVPAGWGTTFKEAVKVAGERLASR